MKVCITWTVCIACLVLPLFVHGRSSCPPMRSYEYRYNTVPLWSPWSVCDHSCGGGVKTRSGTCEYLRKWPWSTDTYYSRTDIVYDQTACNEICTHGTFVNQTCQCPPGLKGRCCDAVPVCKPLCANGGTCIVDNTCKCQSGYYGQWCEIGGKFDEKLKPQLRTRVPLSDTDKLDSWYDVPETSDFSRACYIKVHTQGAAQDTVIKAESALSGDMLTVFGNYTAGPIDANGGMNDSSRFSCLEVRCPGFTSNGTKINVSVNITVTSRYRMCVLKKHALGMSQLSQDGSGNGFSFTMEEGHNYGSAYGIYTGMGFRDKASYVAQHSCFSGHRFDFTHMNPTTGVLAEYTCA